MGDIDALLAGNERFAERFAAGDLPIGSRLGALVITCMDSRVDPEAIFDLGLGDVFVFRTVGGRVTDDTLGQLGMFLALAGSAPGATPPDVVVMHHTDCGTARFAEPELRSRAAELAGVDASAVDAIVVRDPRDSVLEDVAAVRAVVSDESQVVGLVYDVTTGVATPV